MGARDHDGIACVVGQHMWYPDYVGQQWLGGTIASISGPNVNGTYILHLTPDGGGAQILVPADATHHDPKPHSFPDAP